MVIEIPWEELEPAILNRLVEEFVTREGTDYGEKPVELDTKVDQVKQQLRRKLAVVSFDTEISSANIVVAGDLPS